MTVQPAASHGFRAHRPARGTNRKMAVTPSIWKTSSRSSSRLAGGLQQASPLDSRPPARLACRRLEGRSCPASNHDPEALRSGRLDGLPERR